MTNLSVQQRIEKVKSFIQNHKESSGSFTGEYRTPILGLKGQTSGQITIPTGVNNNNSLAKIANLLELQRIRFEKENSVSGDIPIVDFAEATIPDGSRVTFSFLINEGYTLNLQKIQITYAQNSTYLFKRDNIYYNPTTEWVCDYADQYIVWKNPLLCYSQVSISALNLSGEDQTFNVFFGGWLRKYKRGTQLIEAEQSLIQQTISEEIA